MHIRKEEPKDYNKVYNLIKEAFATAEYSDGNEQDLVTSLRKGSAFIPELSLVAEEGDMIIGHIMFTKMHVGQSEVLALAPLSVQPAYQRQGVGKSLITEGHKIAAEKGYTYSVVLGSNLYYPKFGYSPAAEFGIEIPSEFPAENYMAIKLQKKCKSHSW